MFASIIVFFLLFLLPFVIAPFGVTQFEDPKVVIAEGIIIVLFLITLFSKTTTFRVQTKLAVLFACITLLTLVDLVFFKSSISFFGNPFRMQGIFLLWLLLLFSLLSASIPVRLFVISQKKPFVTRVAIAQSNIDQNITKFFLKTGGWLFMFILLVELIVMNFLPLNASQRYVGTLGEPNALAAFAVFVWPFAWFGFSRNKWGYLGKILLFLIVGSILLMTDSRSAMVAFTIQLLFLFLRIFPISFPKIAVVCLLLFVASYVLPFFQNDPYENRVQVWESAFYAGFINPGIGQGFGNIEIALQNSASGLDLPTQYYYVDSSHNIFLDWWVAGGVIGLGVVLYIVYLALRQFIQTQDAHMLVLLLGMLTVLSFNPASVVGLLSFWWIIGRGFSTK